jgi:hypothetical protein
LREREKRREEKSQEGIRKRERENSSLVEEEEKSFSVVLYVYVSSAKNQSELNHLRILLHILQDVSYMSIYNYRSCFIFIYFRI